MKTPVIYIAAPFSWRTWARDIGETLAERGCSINSSWLTNDMMDERGHERMLAKRDLTEVAAADILALCLPSPEDQVTRMIDCIDYGYATGKRIQDMAVQAIRESGFTGGCFHEAQHAFDLGMPVAVLGDRRNIFLVGQSAVFFEDVYDLSEWILGETWRHRG